jgi:DNA-directed RNA polymerase specialized sigma24 family protein
MAALLARISEGDRDAAAVVVERYGPRIQRHVRLRLSPSMRRVFDSLDVMSSMARRFDAAVMQGQVRVESEEDLFRYLRVVAQHAAIDHARVSERLRRTDTAGSGEGVESLGAELGMDELAGILADIPDADDRFIVCSWLSGRSHSVTAEALGMTAAAVRMRFSRCLAALRETHGIEVLEESH